MGREVESALATTVAETTARFWAVNRQGDSTGPPLRVMSNEDEGIVDFASRRAITRSVERSGGLIGRLSKRARPMPDMTLYTLYDGTSMSACLMGRWLEPRPGWRPELARLPAGLSLLDLMRAESLVDVVESGREQVRGEPATRYALKLDVGRIEWPEPNLSSESAKPDSRIERMLMNIAPDPTPKGILPAEVWLDEPGRLVRFSYRPVPSDHPKHRKVPWTTTELWDFGIPPQLEDWTSQPVIDPVTLDFPNSEREAMRVFGVEPPS
jgi:hypothetical protein